MGQASRQAALSIPSLAACRNLIIGAAVQMGVYRYRGQDRLDPGLLLTQPDPDTTWLATLAGTIDDLLFRGRSYWLVLARDAQQTEQNPDGFPVRARWIPWEGVEPIVDASNAAAYSLLEGYRVQGVDGDVRPEDVIRFDSPQPGILSVGARAIASALAIEAAAQRFAATDLPAGVLQNEGTELNEDEAADLIQKFSAARQTNSIAFLQGITYERTELRPDDLQLVEARALAATEMARLTNVPVAMIGASPSGGASALLYSNLAQQLAVMVSNAVAPHLRTIEATLSLGTVTPRGQRVAFDVQAFLRSDPQAAADYALQLYAADLVSRDEARGFLGISSPVSDGDLTPGRV